MTESPTREDDTEARRSRERRRRAAYAMWLRLRRWAPAVLVVVALGVGGLVALSLRATPEERCAHLVGLSRGRLAVADADAAWAFANDALAIRPSDADALHALSVAERARGNDGEAERAARRALASSPGHAGAALELARFLYERNELVACLDLLEGDFSDSRMRPSALVIRALVLTRLGAPTAAAADQERLAALLPDDPRPCLEAGYIRDFLRRTDPFTAQSEIPDGWFHEALRRARKGLAWRVEQAVAELALGRPAEALATLEAAEVSPEMLARPEARATAAMARMLVGRSAAEGDEAVGAPPLRAGLRVLTHLANGDLAQARATHLRATAATPGEPTLLLAEIALGIAATDPDDALRVALDGVPAPRPRPFTRDAQLLHGLLRGVPPHVEHRARLPWLVLESAIVRDEAGRAARSTRARADLAAARAATTDDDPALDVWAALLEMSDGNPEAARPIAQRATLGVHTARGAALHVSALLHLAHGDLETATVHARESREFGPPLRARATSELRVLLASGDLEAARRTCDAVLLFWPDDRSLLRLEYEVERRAVEAGISTPARLAAIEMRVAIADGDVATMARLAGERLAEDPFDGEAAGTMRAAWGRHAERLGRAAADGEDVGAIQEARAISLARAGRPEDARRVLDELASRPELATGPEAARAHRLLAAVNVVCGDPAAALDALRVAESSAEGAELDRVHLGLGRVLRLMGRDEESAQALRRVRDGAAVATIAGAAARELLAHPAGTLDDRAAAEAWLAARGQEDEVAAQLLRSAVAALGGKPHDAVQHARRALELDPGAMQPRVSLAAALADAGDLAAAETTLVEGLRVAPLHGGLRSLLGVLRLAESDAARAGDAPAQAHALLLTAVCGGRYDTLAAARLAREVAVGAAAGTPASTYVHLERAAPGSAAGALFLARVHEQGGRLDDAALRYAAALEAAPRDPVVVTFAVEFALARGDVEEAARAIPGDVADPSGLHSYLRGRVAAAHGDVAVADREFRAALGAHSGNGAAAARLLELHSRRAGDASLDTSLDGLLHAAATRAPKTTFEQGLVRETLSDALAAGGGSWFSRAANAASASDLAFAVGQMLTVERDWPAAVRAYETAVRFDPDHRPAYLQLGTALRRAGSAGAAAKRLQELAEARPANPAAWMALGIDHGQRGDHAAAAEAYRRALSADGAYALAANNLAWTLAEHLDAADEAVTLAESLSKASPDDPEITDTYGWALHRAGKVERSHAALRRACTLRESSALFRLHLARALDAASQVDEALAAYEAVRELDRTLAERERVTERIRALSAGRR